MKEIKDLHHIQLTGSLVHPILQLRKYYRETLQFPGMTFGTEMKIENGSVVMDAGVQRSTYFKQRRVYFMRHMYVLSLSVWLWKRMVFVFIESVSPTKIPILYCLPISG